MLTVRSPIVQLVAAGLLAALFATPVRAQVGPPPVDPEVFAQHCINVVTARAEHCAARNTVIGTQCAAHIELLVENGHPGQALVLAQVCAARINHRSALCVHRIQHRCAVCIHVLNNHDEPELAAEVLAACQAAVMTVQQSRFAALAMIQNALPAPPG